MKVELEMRTYEENEEVVIQKAIALMKQAKQAGFEIEEVELKSRRHEEEHE